MQAQCYFYYDLFLDSAHIPWVFFPFPTNTRVPGSLLLILWFFMLWLHALALFPHASSNNLQRPPCQPLTSFFVSFCLSICIQRNWDIINVMKPLVHIHWLVQFWILAAHFTWYTLWIWFKRKKLRTYFAWFRYEILNYCFWETQAVIQN